MSAPISNKIPSSAEQINPPLVRTLSPPPEIWELVHPVESRQFNPRLNFLRRLKLNATSFILMAMVVGLFLGVCVAVLRLRGVEKLTTVETPQPVQVGSTPSGNETANPANSSAPPSSGTVTQQTDGSLSDSARPASSPLSQPEVSEAVGAQQPGMKAETTTGVTNSPAPARSVAPAAGVRSNPPPARSETPATGLRNSPVPPRSESPATDGAADSSKKSSSDSAAAKPKSNTGTSPQGIAPKEIAPVKSDTERKAKVIQWP